jgi:ATP-GRASP peptide maturase of grasp-with-spasm system
MKRIVIFSELADQTTTKIMKWIIALGGDAERVNSDDQDIAIILLSSDNLIIRTHYSRIEFNKNDIVWFRRAIFFSTYIIEKGDEKSVKIKAYLFNERKEIFESIIKWIKKNCRFVADPDYSEVNKIEVLCLAKTLSINCPEWIMTNNKQMLLHFAQDRRQIASKSFTTLMYEEDGSFCKSIVKLMSYENIIELPDKFQTAIFQKYIDKKYELRVFFWGEQLFPMAIFSQNDEKTKIDFRNYNLDRPNRCVPVKLGADYSSKLLVLAKALKLDTGSFDILVSECDIYYFLEVNPVGQFGMVSYPCNYYIEKFIAKNLLLN